MNKVPSCIWLTGLPGSGKTTLAKELQRELNRFDMKTIILDGDDVRKGINKDLGYSLEDRNENIRRAAEISKLLIKEDFIVICAFVSPTQKIRDTAKIIIGERNYYQVFVDAPISICASRDPKRMYVKAQKGMIGNFTGISSPYEKPNDFDLRIVTSRQSIKECTHLILEDYLNRSYGQNNKAQAK